MDPFLLRILFILDQPITPLNILHSFYNTMYYVRTNIHRLAYVYRPHVYKATL